MTISGHYACLSDWDRGLAVVDISDPTNPRLLGWRDGWNMEDLSVSRNLACVKNSGLLEWVDISSPTSPRRVAGIGSAALTVAMAGQFSYSAGWDGFRVFDNGREANPQFVGGNRSILSAADVAVSGNYAYLAAFGKGLQVVDITDDAKPRPVVRLSLSGVARAIKVAGSYAFVAAGPAGLQVVDISNPAQPQQVSHVATSGEAIRIAVSPNCAYVACGNQGLELVDISDPLHPQVVGHYTSTVGVYGISVSGSHAYLSSDYLSLSFRSPVLEVLDVSFPSNPVQLGRVLLTFLALPTSAEVAFVAHPQELWMLSDTSDPANPKPIGGYRTIAAALGIAVSGHYAYLLGLDHPLGLNVFDLSDHSQPKLVGRNFSSRSPSGLAVVDGKIYLAEDNYLGRGEGLLVLEMLPFFKSISRVNGALHLTWEAWGRAKLHASPSLLNPDWDDLQLPATTTHAELPLGAGSAFFRLRKPSPPQGFTRAVAE